MPKRIRLKNLYANVDGEKVPVPALKGTDAEVTKDNIETALGYTPANEEEVATKEELSELDKAKLTKPDTVSAGKYFRVANVDGEGNPVLEAVDLPIATTVSAGLVIPAGSRYGIALGSAGNISIAAADDTDIKNKTNTCKPLTSDKINQIVQSALIDSNGIQLIDEHKDTACNTLGAATKGYADQIYNKYIAVSNATNINVTPAPHDFDKFEKFIDANKLKDDMHIVDVGAIVEPNSTKYYASILTAISDINSGTFTNAVTSSSGAECQVFKNSDGIVALKLLKNITFSTQELINDSLIVDFNGFSLQNYTNVSSRLEANNTLCLYGVKNNSKVLGDIMVRSKHSFYCIGLAIDQSQYGIGFYGLLDADKSLIYLKKVSYIKNDESGITTRFVYGMRCTNVNLYVIDSTFDVSIPRIIGMPLFGLSDYPVGTKMYAYFDNCNIDVRSTGRDLGDNGVFCLDLPDFEVVIKDSYISGTNNAFQSRGSNYYVLNSILSGCTHGGFYGNTYGRGKLYFKNTEIRQHNEPNMSTNNHSCYIGYDSDVYFDDCKFVGPDGNFLSPAIKTGSDNTYKYYNTQAHFSNCKIDSIRVDSGCRAYMGLGTGDAKDLQVSGEIIDTGAKSYSFNVHDQPTEEW